MNRRHFLTALSTIPPIAMMTDLTALDLLADALPRTSAMPALFVGHGSPTNVLAHNAFTKSLEALGKSLPRPKVVLVVSAHWLTRGTSVSVTPKPETIYDFYGFPEEMYSIVYPCAGAPSYAEATAKLVTETAVDRDPKMGLDHGAWTVLKHMYPAADLPVYQVSIDALKPTDYHYRLGTQLRKLRSRGVLIVGSGNVVHNLREVAWGDEWGKPPDWAAEFDEFVRKNVVEGNHDALMKYAALGPLARRAHPSNDHYLPLMYVLGLQEKGEEARFTFEGFQFGSISMRCFTIG